MGCRVLSNTEVPSKGLTLGVFLMPRSPVQGRQIPAKQNANPSARLNHRHIMFPLSVLVGLRERHRRPDAAVLAIEPRAPLAVLQPAEVRPQLAPGLYFGDPHSM
jgi:hypothetical protein